MLNVLHKVFLAKTETMVGPVSNLITALMPLLNANTSGSTTLLLKHTGVAGVTELTVTELAASQAQASNVATMKASAAQFVDNQPTAATAVTQRTEAWAAA